MLTVEQIKDGVVIDHISAGSGMKLLTLLGVDKDYKHRIALVVNVPSKKMGKKDIVKIEGKEVDEKSVNLIALIAPGATINIIRNGRVVEKRKAQMPEVLTIGRCPNPNCITNSEGRETFMREGSQYRCLYCERKFESKELV